MRDVSEFFMDTGVGTRGYTIVEQGQIAEIVSTKPEERRIIFEEAASRHSHHQTVHAGRSHKELALARSKDSTA